MNNQSTNLLGHAIMLAILIMFMAIINLQVAIATILFVAGSAIIALLIIVSVNLFVLLKNKKH